MDYERKYKNALEWARSVYPNAVGADKEDLEHYFPELAESEDERIRKALIEIVNDTPYLEEDYNVSKEDVLAWLEKQGQGQVKESSILQHEGTHEGASCKENDNSLTREPKFKAGDWITNGQLTCKVLSITSKSYELHLYNDDYCHFETDMQSVDKDYHLWTIKDSKVGDVLTSIGFHSNCTFIFKGLDNWKFDEPNGDRAVATGYCCLSASADKMEFGIQGPDCIEVDTVKPATKIQRDLLFTKMHETGYEWDAGNKKLRKIEQNIDWTEEDKRLRKTTIAFLKDFAEQGYENAVECVEWLESIKQRLGGEK